MQYRATPSFARLLSELRCTLVASLYLDNRLLTVSAPGGALLLRSHELVRPMGLAVSQAGGRTRLAISTHTRTLVFGLASQLAGDVAEADQPCDSVLLPRAIYFTGDIDGHDAAWCDNRLLVINTRFSCLAEVGDQYGFAPVWRPTFISAVEPEDRCHLNGLACRDGEPAYATAFAASDARSGWRSGSLGHGIVIDIPTGNTVVGDLLLPHSPRVFDGRLHLLESGTGRVLTADTQTGATTVLAELPGFTRGLDRHRDVLFVGMSKLREGQRSRLPIAEHSETLICGIAALDGQTGALLGWIAFDEWREIFDVRILPDVQAVVIEAPFADMSETAVDMPGRVFRAEQPHPSVEPLARSDALPQPG